MAILIFSSSFQLNKAVHKATVSNFDEVQYIFVLVNVASGVHEGRNWSGAPESPKAAL